MNELFKLFLSLSLSGSVLIAALFLCKPWVKNRFSKRWQYYIWLVVIARLLLPFAPEVSLMGSAFQTIAQTASVTAPPPPLQASAPAAVPGLEPAQPAARNSPLFSAADLWIVWLAVALVLMLRKIAAYGRFMRYVRAGQTPVTDTRLLDLLAAERERAGVRGSVELCLNPLLSSPSLVGFFRPRIVLSNLELSETEFRHTVLHELTHYRRRDLLYKWLVQLTLCLHWFNPLVWLMVREIGRACEFSCDEAVIAGLASGEVRDYGITLLNAMAGKICQETPGVVTFSQNKELLKERLAAIMKFKKHSRLVTAMTLALTALICTGALTVGAYASPEGRSKESGGKREDSLAQSIEPFRSYGLTYDAERELLLYNGQRVTAFADLRDTLPSGGYAFNVGYFDDEADGSLYLMAAHDENGRVTGIAEMPGELKADLYDALPDKPGTDSTSGGISETPSGHYVYDATTHLADKGVTATDKLGPADIPQKVADWIAACRGSKAVNVDSTVTDGKLDAWIHYDSDDRLAWNLEAVGTTIRLTLFDAPSPSANRGTTIHCQAPAAYASLEVFYGGSKLTVSDENPPASDTLTSDGDGQG